ncbi:hypothetical protein PXK30_03770 [Phaeobacter gallaeciensis]|uniref:hypothetical protein n=1 Tax=Phaeobacter gallaeciensis TaxID=60890 RepID=UPI00237F2B2D|nr:hypothetical protein [Phaeobacter gallaeciensis]MDE4304026.1 hypothetical protein [Phaeobacter gallaeciensis]MDE4309086.1 hypothetical protein [Phaeobacter gallaeciensis]MDE4313360.1 hypothetical protein [Phaeobacter gallaeciensis]MDE4318015.1 hypothetical protein [Phaeobacter gallaeciensis]MDE4322478.1 hypothetical protein [Phaeobacter gallaeciensis]
MSRPLTELFPVGPDTRLDPRFLNGLIGEIEVRVSELQILKQGLEAAISGAQDIALARVNDIIGPAQTDLAERLAQADQALSASQTLLETLSSEQLDIDQIAGLQALLNTKAPTTEVQSAQTSARYFSMWIGG